ncbi:hypothetical protein IE53DRAFT_137037 [Violaceomyces palustris]|uniref:Uncharacterized protein n=1 Tax=Violaceomyces palustris TaxID=1673888 RepID=A0ACD0P6D1_9BASI|nr:hypothetical protein IE53DRAFT_137037 [Violaceomyces palustris]
MSDNNTDPKNPTQVKAQGQTIRANPTLPSASQRFASAASVTSSDPLPLESSDDSQEASLSTTPTQSHVHSQPTDSSARLRATMDSELRHQITQHHSPERLRTSQSTQRDPSIEDGSQAGTIGKGQPPRPSLTPMGRAVSARTGMERDLSQSQRSVSYAPSDLETVSGMSASEYSSGGEEGEAFSRNSTRGRPTETAIRQGTSIGRSNLLVSSSATRQQGSVTVSGSHSGSKGGRRTSITFRDGSKARRASVAPRDSDYLDDDDDRYGPLADEDDEVEPHDRGEELVRRRMKARQREKALRRKREKEAEKQRMSSATFDARGGNRESMAQGPGASQSSPGPQPGSGFASGRATSPSPMLERAGRPTNISLPPPQMGIQPSNVVSPLSQGASFPSPSIQRGNMSLAYPSPHGHIRRPSTNQGGSGNRFSNLSLGQQSTVGPRSTPGQQASDFFSEGLAVTSNAGQSVTDTSSSAAESLRGRGDENEDEDRDTIASLHRVEDHLERRGEEGEGEGEGEVDEVDENGESPSGEDISDEDVEYTLKDRQDAINIEHPFGLPIWKPALYKKSRSITRNAETALHLIPSAAAERHLLPGNILWTVFFGSWLSVVCFIGAVFLGLVPNGGKKYARVAWELGSYLFWPFGKYVEVEVSHESGERAAAERFGEHEVCREGESYENAFTPVAARFPHDHAHRIPFNSRPGTVPASRRESENFDTLRPNEARPLLVESESHAEESSSGGSGPEGHQSTPRASEGGLSSSTSHHDEGSSLKGKGKAADYGTFDGEGVTPRSDEERILAESGIYGYVIDKDGRDVNFSQRLCGTIAFGVAFWLFIAPLMGLVCLSCWGMVFTIPMAKLNWVLLKNLASRPLALHFRSAPGLKSEEGQGEEEDGDSKGRAAKLLYPLTPGQVAPRSKSFSKGADTYHRRSKILLCTYRAVGSQYYKYTVGGVNILFVNTLPLVFFTILDFFVIERYVEHHHIKSGFLAFISGQGVIFLLALGSVIPLSYFIGMAVASISAQSSIGMGAVINATFGSIIEIILYAIALTQEKARLVEGSLIGSILAGVLLMPGLSMCSGATRRKEQRFNARSAGVTSTMLIMAIIGILTPTLFYQIYGTFQLTCVGCPSESIPGDTWTCKRCFYEHVPPATDPFFQENVRGLMYTCTVILVLSYGIGLWFSLRTHASQIWQNPQPAHQPHHHPVTTAQHVPTLQPAQRASIYKRLVPASVIQQLLPTHRPSSQAHPSQRDSHISSQGRSHIKSATEGGTGRSASETHGPPPLHLPTSISQEEYERAIALTASAFHTALQQEQHKDQIKAAAGSANQAFPRQGLPPSDHRHVSVHDTGDDDEGHGGHDAPSWSRATSVSVLLGCTVLYAVIAEILVDVVDVVLDGSGIDEKFLGITLFALVPNTTEFMNAMSFAINGNIALSMEIGSAYALQVCLIQIPAMVAFSAYYNAGYDLPGDLAHRSFTLIFPRWDVIAIIFSVFLLTYTYIEARSNYYRGSICILSYLVLVAGFFFAPNTGDTEMPGDSDGSAGGLMSGSRAFMPTGGYFAGLPDPKEQAWQSELTAFGGIHHTLQTPSLSILQWAQAVFTSLWAR